MPRHAPLSILLATLLAAVSGMAGAGERPSARAGDPTGDGLAVAQVAKRKARKQPPRCRTHTPQRYRQLAANWRKVPGIPKPRWRDGYRDLVLYSINLKERVRIFPFLADGTLDPEALSAIERVFRDRKTDATTVVEPRLVKLLYRMADHFDARQIIVISGYRGDGRESAAGYHGRGRAVDLVLSGVEVLQLARFARQLGLVGVGYYPNAGYIHLDVRERSYFWVDRSGPGQQSCLVSVMGKSAAKWDRQWRPEHDEPRPRRDRHGALLGATTVEEEPGVPGEGEPRPPVHEEQDFWPMRGPMSWPGPPGSAPVAKEPRP